LEKNENFIFSYIGILDDRDKDVKSQLLDCKIKVCEKEISISEKNAAIESWQRRFNQYYKKYQDLKKVLAIPFEEDFMIKVENRAKLTLQTINEGKIDSTISSVLSKF
jgi:hypothetical protein